MVEKDLETKCYKLEWKNEHQWNLFVATAWNIFNRIDCKDAATYEIVINGIADIYNLGIEAEHYDNKMNDNIWNDPWDD